MTGECAASEQPRMPLRQPCRPVASNRVSRHELHQLPASRGPHCMSRQRRKESSHGHGHPGCCRQRTRAISSRTRACGILVCSAPALMNCAYPSWHPPNSCSPGDVGALISLHFHLTTGQHPARAEISQPASLPRVTPSCNEQHPTEIYRHRGSHDFAREPAQSTPPSTARSATWRCFCATCPRT